MPDAGAPLADPEGAFLEHLPIIDRVIAVIARRHALSSSDADEFASWAKSRIIDSDYAVFRKFAGRSSVSTYLSAVFAHLFLDYRNAIWGRWRPSAAATRLGPVGIRLDELLHRDGYTLREAREVLRSAGVEQNDAEIGRMAAQLPARQASSEVSLEALDGTPEEAAHPLVEVEEELDDDGFRILREVLATLQPEDQVILRMRFWDNTSVANIARTLRIDQKPLYRRIEAIETNLRALLGTRGVDRERARDLMSSRVTW
jgi:RNA polymerase sigma factor (sigma-70 family)